MRGKNGKVSIPIPRIDLPHFRYGSAGDGVGRGPGKEGDVVGKEPAPGKGNKASQDPSEGMMVDIDMDYIMKLLQEELELPNLKPKPNRVFEEVRIKYNDIAKVGPMSLLHRRRTMQEALKRTCASGEFKKKKFISPIKEDFRFRQWTEEKIPCSNAVIFFARDGSGSMSPQKCEIVSNIAWWIECYISYFYKKVKKEYVWHDTRALSVDEKTFYGLRHGGGTICSTALQHIANQLKHRFTPDKWNVYVFYFGDGENWFNDNEKFIKILKEDLSSDVVNLFGLTQILAWRYDNSLKSVVDEAITSGTLNSEYYRTTEVAKNRDGDEMPYWRWYEGMPEDERDMAVKNAIKDLIGKGKNKSTQSVA